MERQTVQRVHVPRKAINIGGMIEPRGANCELLLTLHSISTGKKKKKKSFSAAED